jgi:hypothetical protein
VYQLLDPELRHGDFLRMGCMRVLHEDGAWRSWERSGARESQARVCDRRASCRPLVGPDHAERLRRSAYLVPAAATACISVSSLDPRPEASFVPPHSPQQSTAMASTTQTRERKALDHSHHLSELSNRRTVSPLKGLFKYMQKPGIIALAGGARFILLHVARTLNHRISLL